MTSTVHPFGSSVSIHTLPQGFELPFSNSNNFILPLRRCSRPLYKQSPLVPSPKGETQSPSGPNISFWVIINSFLNLVIILFEYSVNE